MRLFALGLAVLLIGLPARPTPAQPSPDTTTALDLPTLLRAAWTTNPTLIARRLEAAAAATRPAQATALPDPMVMAGYRPLAVRGADGVVPSQVMAEQMIPNARRRRLAGEVAAYAADVATAEVAAAYLEVAYGLRTAYYELALRQAQERLVAGFIARLRDFEAVATVRYEVGRGDQPSILKAQVERLRLERQRLAWAAAAAAARAQLARLSGLPLLAHDTLRLAPPALPPIPAPEAVEDALARRPEAVALRTRAARAEAAVDLARAAFLPDFKVGVGFMDMMSMDGGVRPFQDLDARFALQAGLVVPLWKAPRRAALDEARLEQGAVAARYDVLALEVETEAAALRARLEEAAAALALYEEALLPQAETTVASTLSGYTTGQIGFLDLLDAERMRLELRLDYEATRAAYLQAHAALLRTLGLLTDLPDSVLPALLP